MNKRWDPKYSCFVKLDLSYGNGIQIHTGSQAPGRCDPRGNWTDACIGMLHEDFQELIGKVQVGRTPVWIVPYGFRVREEPDR